MAWKTGELGFWVDDDGAGDVLVLALGVLTHWVSVLALMGTCRGFDNGGWLGYLPWV